MSDMLCPICSYRMDAHEALDGKPMETPKPGDFSLCLSCGELLTFDDGGGFAVAQSTSGLSRYEINKVKVAQRIIRKRGRIGGIAV